MASDSHPRASTWRAAARLAARQAGQLGTDQLADIGMDPSEIKRADASGRLFLVHTGVRALGYPRVDFDALHWAAVLGKGGGIRISHRSAVERHDLLKPIGGPVHVSVRRHQRFSRNGVIVHRPTDDADDHTTFVDRLPVSSIPRALVELATCASQLTINRAVHEALVRRLVTVEEVLDELGPSSHRRGTLKLRRALGRPAIDIRSRYEGGFRAICEDPRVPPCEFNTPLQVPWGVIYPDVCWRQLKLIVEVDGDAVHSTQWSIAKDARRDRRLRELGWMIERFPGEEVLAQPRVVLAEVLDLVARARRRHQVLSADQTSPRPSGGA